MTVACRRCGKVGHCAQRDSDQPDMPAGRNCNIAAGRGYQGERLSPPAYDVAPPVALADAGDHCTACHRPLNVNEPLYRASGGKVICAACHDAAPEDATAANVRAFATELSHLRTSEVLRRAADELVASALPGSMRERAQATAAELRKRATLLESVAAGAAARCNFIHRMGCACDVLQAIGEVRS